MARNEQGAPRAPKIDFLLKMVERLSEVIDSGRSLAVVSEGDKRNAPDDNPNNDLIIDELFEESILVGWHDAFDWLATFLENRRDYHKKRNTSNKLEMQLLEEALKHAGVDTAKIRKEAERAADDSIS